MKYLGEELGNIGWCRSRRLGRLNQLTALTIRMLTSNIAININTQSPANFRIFIFHQFIWLMNSASRII
jgi:hypothetical protein